MSGTLFNRLRCALTVAGCLLAGCAGRAWAGSVEVQVQTVRDGAVDSMRFIWEQGRRFPAVERERPTPGGGMPGEDFRARLQALRERNRELLHSLKRDVDAVNGALDAYSKAEVRVRMDEIRRRRMDARLGLNLMKFMDRVGADPDYTARWGAPVFLTQPVPAVPNVLVVNRTRLGMAVDIWDADTVRVGYIPAFSGFSGEPMPADAALQRLADVRVEVLVHDSTAVKQAVEGVVGVERVSGPVLEISVSDPGGAYGRPYAEEGIARGVLVFPSAMAPRPRVLLLDGAEPVSEKDMEGVRVIRTPEGERLRQRLRGADRSGAAAPPEETELAETEGPPAYREGVALLAEGKAAEAARRFREAIAEDRGYGPSYVGLGRAQAAQGQWDEARLAFKQALKRAPGSMAALQGLGEAAFARAKWGDAKDAYGQVLAQDPEHVEALYRRAIAYRETGKFKATVLRWLDWRRSERLFRQAIERDPLFRDVYYQYALLERYRGEYKRAVQLGEQQVAVKPGDAEAERGLLRLYRHLLDNEGQEKAIAWLREQGSEYARYFEGEALRLAGRLAEADSALQAWVGSKPSVSAIPAYLSLARLYYEQGRPEAAEGYYWQAVEGIRDSLDAQLAFEDVKYVVNREEAAEFPTLSTPAEYRAFFRRFWTSRDPTPATAPNARLAEHYRRMLYAEQWYLYDGFRTWFNDPDPADRVDYPEPFYLNDRFNDIGLVYIRHGEPSDVEKRSGPAESWYYWETEAFPKMVFHFAATPSAHGFNWRLIESLYGSMNLRARVRWEVEKEIREAHESVAEGLTTDRHAWPDEVEPLEYDSYVAYFRGEENRGEVALYYGMPLDQVEKKMAALPDTAVAFEYGLTLHDLDWNRVVHRQGGVLRVELAGMRFEEEGIGTLRVQAPPDSFHAAFFLRPSVGHLLGGWKGGLRVPAYSETELEVSSIVPAYTISPEGEGNQAFRFRGVRLVPNPSRRFSRREPVFVYFEVYNLTPDERGATSFEVEYTLTQLRRESVVKKLLSIFGSEKKPETAVTVERLGDAPHSVEYLSLDLSRAGKGDFRLNVRVKDRHTGVEKEAFVELKLD